MRNHVIALRQGSRRALYEKIDEHDTALDALESAAAGFNATNGDTIPLIVGTPVAVSPVVGVRRGWALSQAQAEVVGLVLIGAAQTLQVRIQGTGPMELTAAQWIAVTDEHTALVPGARYYLSTTTGRITTTPPIAPGSCLTVLGSALTTTVLILQIAPYIVN